MADSALPLSVNSRGADVSGLHDALRKIGYTIPKHEVDEHLFGVGTQHAVLSFQTTHTLRRTGVVDERTKTALLTAVAEAATEQYRVEGRILFEYGLPAANLRLRLYKRAFAGPAMRCAETTTDDHGFYNLSYDPGAKTANVDVRAVAAKGAEIPLSAVKFNVDRREVLNLVAPANLRPLAAEYDRLAAGLTARLGSLDKLAEARETDERHDLTLLHQATGWDARLIALAAMAVKGSRRTQLPPDVLYALFRAGLPTDLQRLARVNPVVMEKALRRVHQAGIVRINDKHIATATTAFKKFARNVRLEAKAPGALSTLDELLTSTGLTTTEKDTLHDLYFMPRGAPGELWQRAREKGLSDEKIRDLRLLGKLAYLTFNSAALVASLRQEIVSPDGIGQLVDQDFHREESWKTRVRKLAQSADIDVNDLIPPAYGGATAAERLDAYAADLARKVRVSFPTDVVRRMIEVDDLRLGPEHSALKAGVAAFLRNAGDLGFALGRTPVNAFIAKRRDTLFPHQGPEVEVTIQGVKRLARLYQATPSDGALAAAYDLGFTSARDIAAWPYRVFLDRFAGRFPTVQDAKLTYRKAQQISAVTHNVVTMAKVMDTAPRVYALFPAPQSPEETPRERARRRLIEHYPSLETFLGSADFCKCEHCRSVLSPAAYFVDLLQFLERGQYGTAPYDALVQRRPDLPHLALTCENTNTALPYIDLANEILEYSVVFGSLSRDAARDTGEASTPELLAEPQHVLPQAYDILAAARYPLALPFDLWLETVRRFLAYFGTPLWQVLDVFRPTDVLFADADVAPYDRAAVFAEYLGLSPAEYRIFTAPDPVRWYELYGYTNRDEATTNVTDEETDQRVDLNSAKTLARRLGVSNVEVTEIVGTWFVNPGPDRLRLVDADPALCDFNQTVLQDAQGHPVSDLVFLRINLFVRLWRRLGWTIQDTDRALQVFLPTDALPLTEQNIGSALRTALVYLAHLRALGEQLGVSDRQRSDLLSLWARVPPVGVDPFAMLAGALNLAVPEAAALRELSDLDPVAPPGADPIDSLEADQPYQHTLRFVEVAATVRDSGFTVDEIDYLVRHRFDPVGRYRADAVTQLGLLRTLAIDLARLRAEHAVPSNPTQASALTDDLLEAKLALVFPTEVVATFMGMWTGRRDYTVDEAEDFFEQYLQVHAIDHETRVGFLEADDFDMLFGAEHADSDRRFRLATRLLPFLQGTLGRQLIVQTLATGLAAERPLVDALLTRTTLLGDPDGPEAPLVEAFGGVGERGVTAMFYDVSGDQLASTTVPDVNSAVVDASTGNPAKPPGTHSARFEGYLEVPATGAYRFFFALDANDAAGELRLADVPDLVMHGTADDAPIELKGSVPYRFTFDALRLGDGNVRVLVEGGGLPRDGLDRLRLYPQAAMERARRALTLLAKSLRLAGGFGLSERELRYLLAHRADFNDVDWGSLPTGPDEASPQDATTLFNQFLRLAHYARLKRVLAARSDDLVAIFEADPVAKYQRIAEVTRRDEQTVSATAEQLGLDAEDLVQEQGLWRLWNALQIVAKLGISVRNIAGLTEIVGTGDAPEDRARKFAIADELKRTIKARFEPDGWRRLAQPVFDALRQRQRDALVAYVLHNHEEGFENANQLFEYFLLDPGMEPIVQTSRLRLAISSVQLFIQRCLLNLEPGVPPSAINAGHWEWMKRYRVWEANRKIFLFPENWLESEFRDDKTHLFRELEGALLQGDVSSELVEGAFDRYLKNLERVARLDVVAMYCQTRPDSQSPIVHVIGRTFSLPHKYFYRRHADGMWTPWEPVTAEIDGDHVVAVVWHERLHLFWLTFLEKATKSTETETTFNDLGDRSASVEAPKEVSVQLNWSEYFQGQWTTRESSGFAQSTRIAHGRFDRWRAFIYVSVADEPDAEGALLIGLDVRTESAMASSAARIAFRVVSKNVPPRPETGEGAPQPPYIYAGVDVAQYTGSGALTVTSSQAAILQEEDREFRLLFGGGQSATPALGRRFFYQDNQHTFFVEPGPAVVTLPDFEDLGVPDWRQDPWQGAEDRLDDVPLGQGVQRIEPELVMHPDDPRWLDPLAEFDIHLARDWVTDPATVLYFDEGAIGEQGGQDFVFVPEAAGADEAERRVEASPGSELPAGSVLMTRGERARMPGPSLNVVGGSGVTPVLMRNILRSQGARGLGR